ncbi:hypothetical protein [Rhizocola hellebori]|uniref:hypothetical protein n=1 Tax=Rhizocola hellebori TaxID=1392758 RepID=UPI0019440C16|nr:hypothetical protein [Rhizocola hellebori]
MLDSLFFHTRRRAPSQWKVVVPRRVEQVGIHTCFPDNLINVTYFGDDPQKWRPKIRLIETHVVVN